MPVLEAATTTGLTRTTVHRQYNGKALGFFVLNNLVPIVLHVRIPGPKHYDAVLVYGPKNHKYSPYEDFGLMTKECRKVFTFNIRHYLKCYLPAVNGANGQLTVPYTYNLCQICGASVRDQGGALIQQISRRSYRPDKYVWRASNVLKSSAGTGQIFTARSGAN